MYALAAVAMGLAFLAIVVLMFIPRDLFHRTPSSGVWTPGSIPAWTPPNAPAAVEAPGIYPLGEGRFRVVMHAYNWTFTPDEIRVPVGAEVTFVALSMQDYHGVAIIGTPVIISFDQTQPREATHTFDEPGEYLFVCSEYCGAGHVSMTGRVIVE
jgi:cytochrome c oxidase subunit II